VKKKTAQLMVGMVTEHQLPTSLLTAFAILQKRRQFESRVRDVVISTATFAASILL